MTDATKFPDADRPFVRVGAPSGVRPSGRGDRCGCNNFEPAHGVTVLDLAYAKLNPMIPSWVHVENTRDNIKPLELEIEREVEGYLFESYQTWTDVPVRQWHLWYDWNFWIAPEPSTAYVCGNGNVVDSKRGKLIECEWDTGAIFGHRGPRVDAWRGLVGPFLRGADIGWPMQGEHVWLAGRWIYDCGHPDEAKLYSTELHPVKAWAVARWQAVELPWLAARVPGLRFTFFASRRGGYTAQTTDAIEPPKYDLHLGAGSGDGKNKKQYVFWIKLPEHPRPGTPIASWSVIEEPHHSTVPGTRIDIAYCEESLTVRGAQSTVATFSGATLAVNADYTPFARLAGDSVDGDKGGAGNRARVRPHVTIVDANGHTLKPGERFFETPPAYAQVTIPLGEAKQSDDFYGVHLDVGWRGWTQTADGAGTRSRRSLVAYGAERVMRHVVRFAFIDLLDPPGSVFNWRIGVNGQWFERSASRSTPRVTLDDIEVTLYLVKGSRVIVCSNGYSVSSNGLLMFQSDRQRTLEFSAPADGDWKGHGPWTKRAVDFQRDIVEGDGPASRRAVAVALADKLGMPILGNNLVALVLPDHPHGVECLPLGRVCDTYEVGETGIDFRIGVANAQPPANYGRYEEGQPLRYGDYNLHYFVQKK